MKGWGAVPVPPLYLPCVSWQPVGAILWVSLGCGMSVSTEVTAVMAHGSYTARLERTEDVTAFPVVIISV